MKTCGKNAEPMRVVIWAKTITNEWKDPFDRRGALLKDVKLCSQISQSSLVQLTSLLESMARRDGIV